MRHFWWRSLIFLVGASVPFYWLYLAAIAALGPDPGKVLVDNLGQGALVFLLCSLAMTPLQRLSGWAGWISFRRQLGLWAFVYAVLHLSAYLYFLLGLDFSSFGAELVERPYITVGAVALMGLLALAATSTRWSMRKLGKRWKQLHRLVYPVLLIVLLHMLWVVRADAGRWVLYASIAALLLLVRLPAVAQRLAGFRTKWGRRA
ncbi:sulfoxide reductase heme-binding subunit YedZ [Stutzerimonas xanthomarina]|uniref:protein-methionine-sulfoxide reductase heme-binding subunit MsrQ n=1 Tax=Stutzerimonas nitrititolerans TaxID=2482751 RepID=UPI00082545EB|nr:protein-methionine-sulfoxide reductase heme-binding subunit MsrQ [Stutzerimonas nitrititolerans]MBA1187273.1 protein-methionine-sulfoxide reductase heme-binding subunit MsrQ [Stutzerimonas stutzeri]OCX22933.1 sulfoxide reductase heme-binding subunit YedZ [Stutzerimonas xanthomarina]HBB78118.1 protein-methionine-sulfoxide reductase heme-binding subunit MsrQ [Pseudomonas sp.]